MGQLFQMTPRPYSDDMQQNGQAQTDQPYQQIPANGFTASTPSTSDAGVAPQQQTQADSGPDLKYAPRPTYQPISQAQHVWQAVAHILSAQHPVLGAIAQVVAGKGLQQGAENAQARQSYLDEETQDLQQNQNAMAKYRETRPNWHMEPYSTTSGGGGLAPYNTNSQQPPQMPPGAQPYSPYTSGNRPTAQIGFLDWKKQHPDGTFADYTGEVTQARETAKLRAAAGFTKSVTTSPESETDIEETDTEGDAKPLAKAATDPNSNEAVQKQVTGIETSLRKKPNLTNDQVNKAVNEAKGSLGSQAATRRRAAAQGAQAPASGGLKPNFVYKTKDGKTVTTNAQGQIE